MYDYMLGGTRNLQVDRDATERFLAQWPDLLDAASANRGFLRRAARLMAQTHGVRQFLDIGSGLPTQNNTHETVHQIAPDARVVYVDLDPMVLMYARELLTDDGTTAVIQADLRDPDRLLADPGLRRLIDFSQPVGVLMTAVLQFVADAADPWALVARYMQAAVPGSYLALSHITGDKLSVQSVQTGVAVYEAATERAHRGPRPRSRGSSPAWSWCRHTPAPSRGWRTWASGAPRTRPRPIATARRRSTAGSPASPDVTSD
jgi:S-adenosyl methyltransferase